MTLCRAREVLALAHRAAWAAETEPLRLLNPQFQHHSDASLQIPGWQYGRLLDAMIQVQKQYPRNPGAADDKFRLADLLSRFEITFNRNVRL